VKVLKYLLVIIFVMALAYLTTIESDGEYFAGFATLIKDKSKAAQEEEDKSLHNLDLQKMRPSFNPED